MAIPSLPLPAVSTTPTPSTEGELLSAFRRLAPPEQRKLVQLARELLLAAARAPSRAMMH